MRRAPIVLSATVAGVAGVLSFHAHPQVPVVATSSGGTGKAVAAASTHAHTKANAAKAKGGASAVTTATGAVAQNQYGPVQVRVTVAGGKIKGISAVQLPQSDGKSAEISQYAAPQLQSEAMAAQSAQIDGVSGASYTSQSYETSLQSALDQLGYKA
ncbi:MAG: hypothetical protein QOD53_1600 [Thermoleophilaceae bacterium]|jgi:uncharacterized protein with FMN-binding domain|nr:hypothetical protein [Thermoleophilaceae bacterium]